jgi:hypothetical protein
VGGPHHDFSWWQANREPSAIQQQLPYLDPSRTAATYNATQGGPSTVAAFLAEARLQSRDNWRPQFTADAVNSYIRLGFTTP